MTLKVLSSLDTDWWYSPMHRSILWDLWKAKPQGKDGKDDNNSAQYV